MNMFRVHSDGVNVPRNAHKAMSLNIFNRGYRLLGTFMFLRMMMRSSNIYNSVKNIFFVYSPLLFRPLVQYIRNGIHILIIEDFISTV